MDTLALILVVIGAVNLGSMGLFHVDLLGSMFGGSFSMVSRIIYSVIGLAGLWRISLFFKDRVSLGSIGSRNRD